MKKLILIIYTLFLCNAIIAKEWHPYQELPTNKSLALRFSANSPSIIVRYKIDEESITPNSTPSIDLSVTDSDGKLKVLEGRSEINKNTYLFTFEGLTYSAPATKNGGYEFHLWLPSSCRVKELEIGVDGESFFGFSLDREDKPIAVYSTRNCNDKSAARRWSAILARNIDRELREVATVDLMSQIDAKAFLLDFDSENLDKKSTKRVTKEIKSLRSKWTKTPIFVSNKSLKSALDKGGVDGVHLVSDPANKSAEDYATAYETKLREVLNCSVGDIATTKPAMQRRVPYHKWSDQCQYILREIKNSDAKCAIIGNSIVHNWGGDTNVKERTINIEGQESWSKYMSDYVNLGIGADRIENLLWRVHHDQMETKEFEKIIIMIGTNNLNNKTTVDEILTGVDNLVEQIKIRQPNAQITLIGILPRKDIAWSELQKINAEYEKIAARRGIAYKNIGNVMMDENDTPRNELYKDRVHPSYKGYELMGQALGEL